MRVIRQSSTEMDAVQWDGTLESLRAMQQLLAPGSPLYAHNGGGTKALGVYITALGDKLQAVSLQFVDPGGWVVRDGDDVTIYTDAQFKRLYTAAPGETDGVIRPRGATWTPPSATHPRALAMAAEDAADDAAAAQTLKDA